MHAESPDRSYQCLIIVTREDENANGRPFPPHQAASRNAIHVGHGDIQQHDIGKQLCREADGFLTVAGFTDYLEVLFVLQNAAGAGSHDGVIIREKDAHGMCFFGG